MSPMNNRLLRPTSNYDADALLYINAVQVADGQALEPEVRTAIDAFVRGCKADDSGVVAGRSNWDAIQACCIMAGARTISGALVPLKGTAPTAQGGWTSNEYSRGGTTPGLKGNGSTLYLDSNRAANADGQNDAHMAVYATSVGASNTCYIGAPANGRLMYVSGSSLLGQVNGSAYTTVSGGNVAGFIGGSRASSATQSVRAAGTTVQEANTSTSVTADNTTVFSRGTSLYSAARISFYSLGSALDLAALDARVSALMAAIQAFLP